MIPNETALVTFVNMPELTIEQVASRRNAVVEFTKQAMHDGVDFGKIPGTDKNTLLKPGAEKLCTLFALAPKFILVESEKDWIGEQHGGEAFFYFLYKCELYRGSLRIAEGDGSCNSWEKKYRWRNQDRVCPTCGKPAIIKGRAEYGGGWLCFARKGGCGAKFGEKEPAIVEQSTGQVPNPDISDQVNTLQKMAQKRALIAATLIAVNASEFFTQDMEDQIMVDVTPVETKHTAPAATVQAAPRADDDFMAGVSAPAPKDPPAAAAPSNVAPIINSPALLLAAVQKQTDYYNEAAPGAALFHLSGAIQKQLGNPHWKWPTASQLDAWREAHGAAVEFARAQKGA